MTHPIVVIAELVAKVEPELAPPVIEASIREAAWQRAKQQKLAGALTAEPDLLTSGRPEGPPTVGRLVRALQQHGAAHLVLPRCAECGKTKQLPQTNGLGRRICAACFNRAHRPPEDCAGCDQLRHVRYRDRHGKPRCSKCPPEPDIDHIEVVCQHVLRLDPNAGRETLRKLVESVARQPFQRRDLAWELDSRPDLLTGAGAHGSSRLIVLLEHLVNLDIRNITAPACPFCDRVVRLTDYLNGQRCCNHCYRNHHAKTCSDCGHRRDIVRHTPDGRDLCRTCSTKESAYHEQCSNCGRVRAVGRREGDRVLCDTCGYGRLATCYLCGKEKNCHRADTDKPRCEPCSHRLLNTEACSTCGKDHPVASRNPTGNPLCGGCTRKKSPCIRCYRDLRIYARTEDGVFCKTCYRKDPLFFKTCTQCGTVARLHHYGLCLRCAAPGLLRHRLARLNSTMRPELEAAFAALADNEPVRTLDWLRQRSTRRLLTGLATGSGPVTHALLDELEPAPAARQLRAVLVTARILPPRDEHLAGLERWIKRTFAQITDLDDLKPLRGFSTWHHLKRLRAATRRGPVSYDQVRYVRADIGACIKLLYWLRRHDLTLDTCSQIDLDRWLDSDPFRLTRGFVAWAVRRGYAHDLTVPRAERQLTRDVFPEDHRWTTARRLLHDDSMESIDRVAGLLVLLYAQPASRISQLGYDRVTQRIADRTVELHLASSPLALPEPLGGLVLRLVENRKGPAVIGHTDDHPWLFPGLRPGQPLQPATLAARLKSLGITARIGRNTALMDLGAQLPAAVISKLLGLSISRATQWTQEAGNTRPGYAAEIARRNREASK